MLKFAQLINCSIALYPQFLSSDLWSHRRRLAEKWNNVLHYVGVHFTTPLAATSATVVPTILPHMMMTCAWNWPRLSFLAHSASSRSSLALSPFLCFYAICVFYVFSPIAWHCTRWYLPCFSPLWLCLVSNDLQTVRISTTRNSCLYTQRYMHSCGIFVAIFQLDQTAYSHSYYFAPLPSNGFQLELAEKIWGETRGGIRWLLSSIPTAVQLGSIHILTVQWHMAKMDRGVGSSAPIQWQNLQLNSLPCGTFHWQSSSYSTQ